MFISGHAKSLAEGLFWMLIFKAIISWSYIPVPGKTITHSWHMAPDRSLPRCHLARVPFKLESESQRVTKCHFQSTGGTEGYYAKWERLGPDSQVPHDLTHTCHLEQLSSYKLRIAWWWLEAWAVQEDCSVGIKSQRDKRNEVWGCIVAAGWLPTAMTRYTLHKS